MRAALLGGSRLEGKEYKVEIVQVVGRERERERVTETEKKTV